MKARYLAGMLDGTLHLSISSPDNRVRARLITSSRPVYDALCSVLGADDFKRVVITKRITLSSSVEGSSKVGDPACHDPAGSCPPPLQKKTTSTPPLPLP